MSDEVWLGIISAIATIAVTVITAFGSVALAKFSRRTGIEIAAKDRELVLARAVDSVRWVEEQARKGVVEGGPQKLALARNHMRDRCAAAGVPCPASDAEIDGLLEVALQSTDTERLFSRTTKPTIPPAASGLLLLVLSGVPWSGGCGGNQATELETIRVTACQAAEAAIEAEADCGPDRERYCTPEDFAKIDAVRRICDLMHQQIVAQDE